MDSSPLILMLATTLTMPPSPAVDTASVHKASEVRRFERTRAWMREHWTHEMQVLADSQACVSQARGWGDLGACARASQQRVRLVDSVPAASCLGDAVTVLEPASAGEAQPVLTAGQH